MAQTLALGSRADHEWGRSAECGWGNLLHGPWGNATSATCGACGPTSLRRPVPRATVRRAAQAPESRVRGRTAHSKMYRAPAAKTPMPKKSKKIKIKQDVHTSLYTLTRHGRPGRASDIRTLKDGTHARAPGDTSTRKTPATDRSALVRPQAPTTHSYLGRICGEGRAPLPVVVASSAAFLAEPAFVVGAGEAEERVSAPHARTTALLPPAACRCW